MQTYTYQIGEGTSDGMGKPTHSEKILADNLGEAIDKARAMTRLRPSRDTESTVCLLRGDETAPVWTQTVEQIRAGDRLAAAGGGGSA